MGKINELLTLKTIFGERFFSIPDYQRGYSWEGKHINALLFDIEHLMKSDYIHYTGTIVATKKSDTAYDIVDGQQRLTTLVILIHELLRRVDNTELFSLFIKRGEYGNQRLVFEPNSETKDYFHKTIIEDNETILVADIASKKNILAAKKIIREWLEGKLNHLEILETITTRLGFLFFSPINDDEIGIMFEVINDRGKPLSQLEKIKNYLLYFSAKSKKSNLKEKVVSSWPMILNNLSLANKYSIDDEDGFLRFCWLVYFDTNKSKSYYVHDGIKERYPVGQVELESYLKLEGFIDFIVCASRLYAQFFNKKETTGDKELDSILSKLRAQNTYASIMPLYLAIMAKEQDVKKRIRLLGMLEILNFRVYILPDITKRTDTGQGELFALSNEYFSDYDKTWQAEWSHDEDGNFLYDNIQDRLLYHMKNFILIKYCPDTDFKKALELEEDELIDYYRWGGLRYFLMNYEEDKNKKKTIEIDRILLGRNEQKVNDYYSIEHIWATKNKDDSNNRPKDNWQKRRLGNFAMLEMGINIQAADKDLSEKIDVYKGGNSGKDASQLKQIQEIEDICNASLEEFASRRKGKDYFFDLYKSIFDKRETKMIEFAKKRWDPNNI